MENSSTELIALGSLVVSVGANFFSLIAECSKGNILPGERQHNFIYKYSVAL
jgi:hypothetical protein